MDTAFPASLSGRGLTVWPDICTMAAGLTEDEVMEMSGGCRRKID